MLTVGYGDITPVNIGEKIYVVLAMLISISVFGYTMNRIGSIFESLSLIDMQTE